MAAFGASAQLRARWRKHWREYGSLALIVALSAFLNLYRLTDNGLGNVYYSTAVRSMSLNWHNWFYVSFDPGGFVSVDKPPLALWIQVASVKLLGYSSFSLLLPEALAGILSVILLWRITRITFGAQAAALSALALALMPISVVVNRDNILDSFLVLAVLLATLACLLAVRRGGSLVWLLVCAVILGLAFNIKMLEAYLVLPALTALYLLCAPRRLWARLGHLLAAGCLLLAVSFSWALAVDLTPARQRPFAGSSHSDSVIELALGYNGLERLLGRPSLLVRRGAAPQHIHLAHSNPATPGINGIPGPLRLFQMQLGPQVSWLLPLALFGLLAGGLAALGLWRRHWRGWRAASQMERPHFRLAPSSGQAQGYLLWGTWLLTLSVFFSAAIFFNVYYLVTLAPAICALAGVGALRLWTAYRRPGWTGWLFPIAIGATSAEQAYLLLAAPNWMPWLRIVLPLVALAGSALLVMLRLRGNVRTLGASHRVRRLARDGLSIACLAVLLLAPTLWTLSSLTPGNAGDFPLSGPERARSTPPEVAVDSELLAYLLRHRDGYTFLVATVDAQSSAPLILASNAPVMTLGGYGGGDHILSVAELAQLVAKRQIAYFLLPAALVTHEQAMLAYGARMARIQTASAHPHGLHVQKPLGPAPQSLSGQRVDPGLLARWILTACAPVSQQAWDTYDAPGARQQERGESSFILYDCQAPGPPPGNRTALSKTGVAASAGHPVSQPQEAAISVIAGGYPCDVWFRWPLCWSFWGASLLRVCGD